MFLEENPSRWERSARKNFIKPMLLGANGAVHENPKCWEHSVSLRKPDLLGAVEGGDVFEKQSTALAAARTINPCNHTT